MSVPVLPESSPFSSEQRNWLNGFFAGLASLENSPFTGQTAAPGLGLGLGASPAAPQAPTLPVLILYGSQSGTAEGLAQALSDKLAGFVPTQSGQNRWQPRVQGMNNFKEINWSTESQILMLTSTWGEGDMPDNAVAFWNWLKSPEAPAMGHAHFAVLGLGDHNYARFCQAGKNLDLRFAELGAKRLLPLSECDTDYETKSAQWMDATLSALQGLAGDSSAMTPVAPAAAPAGSAAPLSAAPAIAAPTVVASGAAPLYNRKNPFQAPLLENHPLNAKGSSKDTRHLAFSLLGSGLEYKAGDALGIYPRNGYELVDRIILCLNCLGNEKVTLEGGERIALRAGLISKTDLRRGTERLLLNLRQACKNLRDKRRLDELLGEDGAKARPYLATRDVLDVLMDFPHTHIDSQVFVSSLGKIAPRLYSISSSPKEHPDEVHLTVAVVRYSAAGRRRLGVSSAFMAERVPLGMTVPIFVQPTAHFTVPAEPGRPIIMVGPGTGVAPFRAFLQERRNTGDTGKNWLFFGDQHRQHDFLYAEEFAAMEASGFLTRLDLAFSRDQEEKIYVQNRILENSREMFEWLEAGAHFYVCGDAKHMAKDVEAALLQVIEKESGKGPEAARAYLEAMKTQKRYQRDVY